MTFNDIHGEYGARNFRGVLSKFLVEYANQQASLVELWHMISHFRPNFSCVSVFQKVKIWIQDLQGHAEADDTLNVVRVHQQSKTKTGCKLSAQFDTVLVDTSANGRPDQPSSIQGLSHVSSGKA